MAPKPKCLLNHAVDWFREHPGRVPQDLAGLSEMPLSFRRAWHNVVDAETRARFWSEHLMSFVGEDSELTEEQQQFISESAELFDGKSLPYPTWPDGAVALFSMEQVAEIFRTLGPPEPPDGLPYPEGFELEDGRRVEPSNAS